MGINKIKTIEEISKIAEELKKNGKKIVHCHGCYDLLHLGHVMHFEDAKKQGDILIVTVTPDIFIQKGPGRPFYNQDLRLEFLSNLELVDYVALNKWDTAVETIKMLKPDVYVKGKEVLGNRNIDEITVEGLKKSNLAAEIEVLESFGGKVYLTDRPTFSSSQIINQFTDNTSEEGREFLLKLKSRTDAEGVIKVLESLKDLRVLVIGEAVLDQYIFCKNLDKSGKESLVAYRYLYSENYLGGLFAVANQIACFTDNVSILTCIGNNYEYIDENLNKNVERNIIIQKGLNTIVKTRYLDDYRRLKIFEVYNTEDIELSKDTEDRIIKYLDQNLLRFDLIICLDYGHGTLNPRVIDYLCKTDKFLAINTQLNAGNMGYNFITKYKRANFVSLNEKELRLPFQEKTGDIKIPITKLVNHFNLDKINITLGKSGSIYYYNKEFYRCPAFTKEPIDTTGSGDKILSLTSLLAYKSTDPYIFSFLSNLIGGMAVRIIGNRSTVPMSELKKSIHYIMR